MIKKSFIKNAFLSVFVLTSIQVSVLSMAGFSEQDLTYYSDLSKTVFQKLEGTDFEESFKSFFPRPSFTAAFALAMHIDKLLKTNKIYEDNPTFEAVLGKYSVFLSGTVLDLAREVSWAKKNDPIDISGEQGASYWAMKKAAFGDPNSKIKFFAKEFESDKDGEISFIAVLILASQIKGSGMRQYNGSFEVNIGSTSVKLSGEFASEVYDACRIVQEFSWR